MQQPRNSETNYGVVGITVGSVQLLMLMAGVAVAVAVAVVVVLIVLCKLLLGHMLNYADFKCLKSRYETLWCILCRVVGYCHTLSCNIALNALYALAVEVVVDLLCAAFAVNVGNKYCCYGLLCSLLSQCSACYCEQGYCENDNLFHLDMFSFV